MRNELSIDERAALRRVLHHVEDEAPLAPGLPGALLTAPNRRRSPLVIVAAAFIVAVAVIGPAAWLLGGEGAVDPTGSVGPSVAPRAEVEAPPGGDSEQTGSENDPIAPATIGEREIPEVFVIEPVTVPIVGVESFELAADKDSLFAAASVPNPDVWDERVWASTDGGGSWREILTVVGEGIVVDIAAAEFEILVLVSGHVVDGPSYLYRSVDGGELWTQIEIPVPEEAVGIAHVSIAIGDSTVVGGWSWDGVLEESFNDGAVLSSTALGNTPQVWVLNADDRFGPPIALAESGILHTVVWAGNEFVGVGTTAETAGEPAIWTSPAGHSWTAVNLPPAPTAPPTDELRSATVGGDGTVLAIDGGEGSPVLVLDTLEWSVPAEAFEVYRVIGTDWGFVAGARPANDTGELMLMASVDGVKWTPAALVDAYLSTGVATTDGVYMNAHSADLDGAGIWVVKTP